MAPLEYDIKYDERRNRLTNAFRLILAFPHLIVAAAWGWFAEILAIPQWFIILFTGQRNQDLWELQNAWLGYQSRVSGYANLMFDDYPEFGTAVGRVPVSTQLAYEEPADRLTNGLRFIWVIPAMIIGFALSIAVSVIVFIAWFAILFSGKHARGFFDFTLRVLRYLLRLQAYSMLMTDTYPKFDSGGATPAGTAGYWTGSPGSPSAPAAPGGPLPPPRQAGGPLPPPAT